MSRSNLRIILPERVLGSVKWISSAGEAADLFDDVVLQLLFQLVRLCVTADEGHEAGDAFALDGIVGLADDGGLGDLGNDLHQALSTSIVLRRWPMFSTSSTRPMIQKQPSWSRRVRCGGCRARHVDADRGRR